MSNPLISLQLPGQHHKFLLFFNPNEAEKLSDNMGCDYQIELLLSEANLQMGSIYQSSQEEEKVLLKYHNMMIKEGKICSSSSTIGSPILFVPKPNGHCFSHCIDYWHLNHYTMMN